MTWVKGIDGLGLKETDGYGLKGGRWIWFISNWSTEVLMNNSN